jgi:glycosyltransferase involved in cell wall biosynthesis
MAVGKPIIMGVKGDAADMVRHANCGIVIEPQNPINIADSVMKLASLPAEELRLMGDNGRQYYYERLSLEIGSSRFASLFEKLAELGLRSA